MLLSEELVENLSIFSNNLSYYYIFCVLISLIAVFVACFCQRTINEAEINWGKEEKIRNELENSDEDKSIQSSDSLTADKESSSSSSNGAATSSHSGLKTSSDSLSKKLIGPTSSIDRPVCTDSSSISASSSIDGFGRSIDSSVASSTNSAVTTEREILLDTVASRLSPDEVKNEREIERQQLEEIFKLVNEQKDVFKIGSIQDLEDQLKLYR